MSKRKYRRPTVEEKRIELKKTNGHCAYCGKAITTKTMTIDHVTPRSRYSSPKYADRADNRLPVCMPCNRYKHARTLKEYRLYMRQAHLRLRTYYVTKILERYGIVELHPWDGLFWFEKNKSGNDSKNDSKNESGNETGINSGNDPQNRS
jgi:HNH endonuclease